MTKIGGSQGTAKIPQIIKEKNEIIGIVGGFSIS
jgi:hypothetical protein